jgi:hypothetical protein
MHSLEGKSPNSRTAAAGCTHLQVETKGTFVGVQVKQAKTLLLFRAVKPRATAWKQGTAEHASVAVFGMAPIVDSLQLLLHCKQS